MRRDVRKDVLHIMQALEKEVAERGPEIQTNNVLSIIGTTLYILETRPRIDYLRFLGEMGVIRTSGRACNIDIEAWHAHPLHVEAHPSNIDGAPTGMRSQREQIGTIKNIMYKLSRTPGDHRGISLDEIRKAACEDMDDARVSVLLKRLAQNGEIYSPAPGFFKLSSEG